MIFESVFKNKLEDPLLPQVYRKVMVHGPYGSGKTQTLFYLEHFLKTKTPSSVKEVPHTIYINN